MFQRFETPFGCIKRYINIDYLNYYIDVYLSYGPSRNHGFGSRFGLRIAWCSQLLWQLRVLCIRAQGFRREDVTWSRIQSQSRGKRPLYVMFHHSVSIHLSCVLRYPPPTSFSVVYDLAAPFSFRFPTHCSVVKETPPIRRAVHSSEADPHRPLGPWHTLVLALVLLQNVSHGLIGFPLESVLPPHR